MFQKQKFVDARNEQDADGTRKIRSKVRFENLDVKIFVQVTIFDVSLMEALPGSKGTVFYLLFLFQTNENRSTWNNLLRKIKTLSPFLWPKKDFCLQFRVIFCFLLLAGGRVINLYVPIYNKLIGKNN